MPYITGPLGLWPFPLLNFILKILQQTHFSQTNRSGHNVVENVEKWEWVDYKGRKREIIIHRKVRVVE